MLVIGVAGVLGSWFLFQKIAVEEAKLKIAKDNYNTTLEQLKSFEVVKSDFEKSKSLKSEMENMTVQTDNVLGLIEELEKAAQSSGVILKTSVGQRPNTSSFPKTARSKTTGTDSNSNQEVWLQLEADGNFTNILQFVRYVENARKLVSVASISVGQLENIEAGKFPTAGDESLGKLKAVILVTNVF